MSIYGYSLEGKCQCHIETNFCKHAILISEQKNEIDHYFPGNKLLCSEIKNRSILLSCNNRYAIS